MAVDVVLDDGGEDEGEGGDGEASDDAMQSWNRDVEAPPEVGEDEVFEEWDEDDERDGVDVRDEVVGDAVGVHSRGLGNKVVVHLVVAEP